MLRICKTLFAAILLVGLASQINAFGQLTSGDIAGTVLDSAGAAVGQATITAINLSTSTEYQATSGASGEFHIGNLPAGNYDVTGSANGFSKFILKGLTVKLNEQTTAKLVLQVAATSTQIEVDAQAGATIDTTTPQLGVTFETKELQDLPTSSIGLGVLNLSLLSPGVGTSGGIGAGTGPSVGGQRPRNNNYTVEGIDNNDKSVTGPLVQVPNDAVAEFTLLTNQFSPEFGHSTGGQFNVVVTSGSNQFHGRAYEYFENRNLNAIDAATARSFTPAAGGGFNDPNSTTGAIAKAPYNSRFDDNRFGGQAGGPILKDKLFVFGNYEYNPIGQSLASGQCTPTANGYATLNSLNALNVNNYGIFKKYVPAATGNPATSQFCPGPVTVNNGVIGPASAIEVADLGIAGALYTNNEAIVVSGDWNISPKDSMRVRYVYNKQNSLDTAAYLPAFWLPIPSRYQLVAGSLYHTFTPNISNEARLGYNRYYNITPSGNFVYPGLDVFPNIEVDDLTGADTFGLGPDGNAPQETIQNLYQFTDNITWVKGAHTLKFGFDGRKFISPQSFTQRVRGDYEYGVLSEYLNDLAPSTFGERSSGDFIYYGDQTAFYGFANDQWRATPTITLNYGLRYEFTSVPTGERVQTINSAASVPGLIVFGKPQPQYKNFMPRLGIAWAPGGSGDWSVRAGFGMGVDVLYDNLGILSFPPQYSATTDVGDTGLPQPLQPNFLANGGLPAGNGGIIVYPDLATQRASTSSYVPNQKLPYSETWNLGVQHAFLKNYTAEVRYVGTRGIHLPVQARLNRFATVTGANYLPTFTTAPSQAELDGLTNNLTELKAISNYVPAYANAGFNSANIVSFEPFGSSNYNGLDAQVQRRFEHGFQFNVAYTWSRTMDNSTADVFSTVLTPRRAQDWQNFNADYSRSALDHTNRFTMETIYDLPFFKTSSNWFEANLLGNWEVAPIWTVQSGEWVTPQGGVDANLNGDAAGDRTVINRLGKRGTGSGITPLANSAGTTVGYLATNPNAYFIEAGAGALATAGRNDLQLPRINDWDVTILKRIAIKERYNFEFQAQALNVFNHSQYISGYVNQINSFGDTGSVGVLRPQGAQFDQPTQVFPNNARTMTLVAKFIF